MEAEQGQRGLGLISFDKVFPRFPIHSYVTFVVVVCLFCVFFICANTVLQIVTKGHSTRFPIILHVLIYVLFLCAQSCSTSLAPNFGAKGIMNVFLYVLCISGTQITVIKP